MHSSESPYASVGDENDDVDGRTIAARARLTPYQFEKLKFLVCSIFGKTQVEASESVGSIYDLLLGYHGGKEENATDTMCLMLEQVSRKFHHSKKSSFNSDILSNKDYQWRAKLIKCADEVKKQRKVLNYIHETFDLDSSTEDFSSPILLFEHMIQSHRLTVGKRTDLERVEKATTLFRAKWRNRIIMFTVAIITLAAFVFGLLLSMVKYANIANLLNNRTVYYSANVTLSVNRPFDLRYYDKVNIHIVPQTTEHYSYNACLCQVPCDADEISTTLTMDFRGSTVDFNSLEFVMFPGLEHPRVPGLFMLKGSRIGFAFTRVDGTIYPNSTVKLYVFTDVDDCREFRNRNKVHPPQTMQILTQQENFKYDFIASTNDYVCIVIETPVNTIFNYTAKGIVLQYHNLAYLSNKSLCETNSSATFETPSLQGTTISLPLRRPLRRSSAPSPQHTCVLIIVTDNDSPVYSVFETKTIVFGANTNLGVISLAVFAFLFLLFAVILLLVCVYVSC